MTQADPLETLRQRTSSKWTSNDPDVLPMFVAEMDFPLAPAIQDALRHAIEIGDSGYVNPRDRSVAEAFGSCAHDRSGSCTTAKPSRPCQRLSSTMARRS